MPSRASPPWRVPFFGSDTSTPPPISAGERLIAHPVGKTNLLMRQFDSNQCLDQLSLPQLVMSKPPSQRSLFDLVNCTVFYMIWMHIAGLPFKYFPFVSRADLGCFIARKLSAVFRIKSKAGIFIVCWQSGSFPVFWRTTNFTPVPKGQLSPFVENYRPIAITSEPSKAYEQMISTSLVWIFWSNCILLSQQYAFRKGLGTCDALLNVPHVLQAAVEVASEARLAW